MKKWEQRERRKASEYEEERRREIARLRDEENEAKRTLEFLEDYKDEAEDTKHYKFVRSLVKTRSFQRFSCFFSEVFH